MSIRFRGAAPSRPVRVCAVVCVTVGCAFASPQDWPIPSIIGSVVLLAMWMRHRRNYVAPVEVAVKRAESLSEYQSVEEAKLVQDLFGPYAHYVSSAAARLGEYRNAASVPSLINVLDRSAWRTEPGWGEASTSIVEALAKIGDGRGLPVLNRVRFSRGEEFRHEVDLAIGAITSMRPINDYRTPTNTHSTNKVKGVPLNGEEEPTPGDGMYGSTMLMNSSSF